MQGRGRDDNMRAAVIHALRNMPVGTAWVAPPELLDRIEPVAAHPVWPNVRRDPTWLYDALAPTGREYVIDPEQLPGRLVVSVNRM